MRNDCLFCGIADGDIPSTQVHADDLVVAFRDIAPKAPVHVLVIPREHIASAADVADGHGALLSRMFAVAAQVARADGIAASGYRLVSNVGADAGQSVGPLHLHVMGGRLFSWPPG